MNLRRLLPWLWVSDAERAAQDAHAHSLRAEKSAVKAEEAARDTDKAADRIVEALRRSSDSNGEGR